MEDTHLIAKYVLEKLGTAGVISLEGPLGAGKTHFVKAMATILGLPDEVTSPTFTLLQSYGSLPLLIHHCDFYRFKNEAEVFDLGLDDYFAEGLTVIEWGNKFPHLLPQNTTRIIITPLEKEVRKFEIFLSTPCL